MVLAFGPLAFGLGWVQRSAAAASARAGDLRGKTEQVAHAKIAL